VVVYEKDGWVGGRTRTDRLDGFHLDAGAQLFASMYTGLFRLADELGIRPSLVRSPGRDALLRNGRVHEVVYGSVTSMLTSGGLPLRTKLKLGSTYLPFLQRHAPDLDLHEPERAARAGLDRESIATWGERELGSDFVEYLGYPQLASYFGSLPEQTSAGLYHILARHGTDVSVHAVRGGASVLAESLAQRVTQAGGEVLLDAEVTAIATSQTGVSVSVAGGTAEFDGAVVSTPAPIARRLLATEDPDLVSWLDAVRVVPMLTIGLLLDRPAGVRYFGLSFPRGEAAALASICVLENKGADLVPEGRGALIAIVRPDVSPRLIEADSQAVVDAVLPDVLRIFPGLEPSIRRARVYRWPDGNPIIYPGYLSHLERFRALSRAPRRLVVAGDYLYTPSVEGAISAGRDAARHLEPVLSAEWNRS
jgi:protoporphyrinogen/coproporphyrinogen III oxidase